MRPHRRQPTRLPHLWDSPGKSTGVGCHFFLQCMQVKSESEVAQSCLTLSGPMDCSPPGSTIHGIIQARVLEWVAIAFSTYAFYSLLIAQILWVLFSPLAVLALWMFLEVFSSLNFYNYTLLVSLLPLWLLLFILIFLYPSFSCDFPGFCPGLLPIWCTFLEQSYTPPV